MDTIENKYVEITKISEYFGVSNTTVRSWVKDSKIPRDSYIKILAMLVILPFATT